VLRARIFEALSIIVIKYKVDLFDEVAHVNVVPSKYGTVVNTNAGERNVASRVDGAEICDCYLKQNYFASFN
jgi:hypothetical protein